VIGKGFLGSKNFLLIYKAANRQGLFISTSLGARFFVETKRGKNLFFFVNRLVSRFLIQYVFRETLKA
jgi:hypothetical protein